MENISWTNCVKNDKESLESRAKGTSCISYIQWNKGRLNWICYTLHRNWLLCFWRKDRNDEKM